jgi:hypothetical protein
MAPYRIRFMAEIGCDFALWGDPWRPLPHDDEYDAGEVGELECLLPITEDLRDRILAWADRFCRYDGGDRDIDMSDFDGLGMYLSRELQRELGLAYSVKYHFSFAGGRERWMPLVEDDPCPGWTA